MSALDDKGIKAAARELLAHGEFSSIPRENEPNALVAAQEAITAYLSATLPEAPEDVAGVEPVAWVVQLLYSRKEDRWSGEMLTDHLPDPPNDTFRVLRPLYPASALTRIARERDEARKSWRCFHCDEVFTTEYDARMHFGRDEGREPGCCIKVGADRGLLAALRHAEADAADAWFKLQNESGEAAIAYAAQSARHQEQLRVVEEAGYEKGLRDAKHEAERAEAAEAEVARLTARLAEATHAVRDARIEAMGRSDNFVLAALEPIERALSQEGK